MKKVYFLKKISPRDGKVMFVEFWEQSPTYEDLKEFFAGYDAVKRPDLNLLLDNINGRVKVSPLKDDTAYWIETAELNNVYRLEASYNDSEAMLTELINKLPRKSLVELFLYRIPCFDTDEIVSEMFDYSSLHKTETSVYFTE